MNVSLLLWFLLFSFLQQCLQITSTHGQNAAVPIKPSNARKNVLQKSTQRTSQMDKVVSPKSTSQMGRVVSPKSSQASSGNYDSKLVEAINTAIVDRSPSVRWDDVGKILISMMYLCFYFSFIFLSSFFILRLWVCSWS